MSYVEWCKKHNDQYKGDECGYCRQELDEELEKLRTENASLKEQLKQTHDKWIIALERISHERSEYKELYSKYEAIQKELNSEQED